MCKNYHKFKNFMICSKCKNYSNYSICKHCINIFNYRGNKASFNSAYKYSEKNVNTKIQDNLKGLLIQKSSDFQKEKVKLIVRGSNFLKYPNISEIKNNNNNNKPLKKNKLVIPLVSSFYKISAYSFNDKREFN